MRDDTLSLICTSGEKDVKGSKLVTEYQLGFVLLHVGIGWALGGLDGLDGIEPYL